MQNRQNYSDRYRINRIKNNSGFTLVEVLVAVVILLVISVPVFRAFASAANTNGKAMLKTYATNAAEDIMEYMVEMDVKAAVDKFGMGAVVYDGVKGTKYNMVLDSTTGCPFHGAVSEATNDCSICKAISKNMTIVIAMDPEHYTNTNAINLSKLDAVSSDYSAIFNMSPETDKEVCMKFAEKSVDYCEAVYPEEKVSKYVKDAEWFAQNLKREIRIDINKTGTIDTKDESDNAIVIDKVAVNLTVTYLLPDAASSDKIVDDNQKIEVKYRRELFNNETSENPLNSIFIMYYPIFNREANPNGKGDIIIVHNNDDVETNLYVIAQNTTDAGWEDYLRGTTGLNLQIYENEIADSVSGGSKQPITLRTNLIDKVDYIKGDSSTQYPVNAYINVGRSGSDPEGDDDEFDDSMWKKLINKKGQFARKSDAEALNAGSIDGKLGDATKINDRIYDVTVLVANYSGSVEDFEAAGSWPVSVSLTGSITQ